MRKLSAFLLSILVIASASAQTDTLRVMAYNVLNYGEYPLCQGSNSVYHSYLKTIVAFANPDIISLEKMGSIQNLPTDYGTTAAPHFQDSILQFALNAAYPARYTNAPFTNFAGSHTESLLFYDQQKLGFEKILCTYTNTEDFNTYKLYYKDPSLSSTHDTTFLYVTVNHDISGSGNASLRAAQINGMLTQIATHFSHLPNMINMGDFNVHNSGEGCYQALIAPADTNFRFYDPPFYPDGMLTYPADWDNHPSDYAQYLTTSTRSSSSVPNSCGTGGGGKDWYDHIFLSPWIVNGANYVKYIPRSFRALGNDGNREGKSINDSPVNLSAPSAVIDALFQMSNKYPVMVDLAVTSNINGVSPVDPEIQPVSVANINAAHNITLVNPVEDQPCILSDMRMAGHKVRCICTDMTGRVIFNLNIAITGAVTRIPYNLQQGVYNMSIIDADGSIWHSLLIKR